MGLRKGRPVSGWPQKHTASPPVELREAGRVAGARNQVSRAYGRMSPIIINGTQKTTRGVGEAQWLESLPSVHRDLRSGPRAFERQDGPEHQCETLLNQLWKL